MLRLIGDVHAQVDFAIRPNSPTYLELIGQCEHSIQLGDMGDAEAYAVLESYVDHQRHRFLAGNHDHYDRLPRHSLGDFGSAELGGVEFFFVRGARSDDKAKLVERGRELGRRLWFEEEELSEVQLQSALDMYVCCRPHIVLSHTSPTRITKFVHDFICEKNRYNLSRHSKPSPTTEMLERMLDVHRPKLWCFGHYHHDWHYFEDGTHFFCVGELSYLDVDSQLNVTSASRRRSIRRGEKHTPN